MHALLIFGAIILLFIFVVVNTEPQCPHKFNKWERYLDNWQRRECEVCGLQEERRIE